MFNKGSVTINPVRLASSLFLIISPYLTWITIVSVVIYQGVIVFGTAAQSNLLMVSSNQLGTNVSTWATSGAALSLVLLTSSGLAMLKSAKVGVPLAILGLSAYLLPNYSIFGAQTTGFEQTFISPGVGLFVAGIGVLLGFVSPAARSESFPSLLRAIRTRDGLLKTGIFASVVGLSLDVMNHAALGQLPDFIGITPVQQFLHLGLATGVSLLFAALVLRGRANTEAYIFLLSAATLALLGADTISSTYTGNLNSFLGHNLTETFLHLSVYYGVVLTMLGSLMRRS